MAFNRGHAARREIEAESAVGGVGGDLYAFLDETPPAKPRGLARARSVPPGTDRQEPERSRCRERWSSDDRPPAAVGGRSLAKPIRELCSQGPLIQPPLMDLYVVASWEPMALTLVRLMVGKDGEGW
eukprot:Skav221071  [mRNA]  locus=scaffold3118:276688:279958:- [translate_table: standard]